MAEMNEGTSSSDEMSDYACDVSLNADRGDPELDETEELAGESYDDFDVIYVADENKIDLKEIELGEEKNFEERFKDQPHPMLIPEIVNLVGTYLDYKNLEKLRSVCTTWNGEFCKVLRKTRKIEFIDAESVNRYNQRMRNTRDFPHVMFELMQEDIPDTEPHMIEFFQRFGPHIKYLTFGQVSVNGNYLFQTLWAAVPNLESLIIFNHPRRLMPLEQQQQQPKAGTSKCAKEEEESFSFLKLKSAQFHVRGPHSVPFIKDLLQLAPNLVKISHLRTCTGPQPDTETVNRGTILMTSILESTAVPRHLSFLDFRFTLSEPQIDTFLTKSFPLCALDIVLDARLREKNFNSLMDSLQQTLRKLEITFSPGCSPAFRFSRGTSLSSITSLTLHHYRGSMMFIQDMPELKSLTVDVPSLSDAFPTMGFQRELGPKGHGLICFRTKNDASDDFVVRRIAVSFPNLKELSLGMVTDEGLNVIYRELPFISDLNLSQGTFTDSGISGVPAEVIKDLWETRTFYYIKPEQFRRSLFLGCLTNLYKVNLESDEMGDLAVIFGLTGCSRLRSLCLKSKKVSDMSMPTIGQSLRNSLTTVDISACPEVSEAGNYVLRQKQPSICVINKSIRPAETTQGRFYRRIVSSDFDEREQIIAAGAHRIPFHFRLRDEMEAWYLFNDRAAPFRRLRDEVRPRARPRAPAAEARAAEPGPGPAPRAGLNMLHPARVLRIDAEDDDDDYEDLVRFPDEAAMAGLRADEALEAAEFFRRLEGGQIQGPYRAADGQLIGPLPADDGVGINNNNNENFENIEDNMELIDVGEPGIPPTPPPFV